MLLLDYSGPSASACASSHVQASSDARPPSSPIWRSRPLLRHQGLKYRLRACCHGCLLPLSSFSWPEDHLLSHSWPSSASSRQPVQYPCRSMASLISSSLSLSSLQPLWPHLRPLQPPPSSRPWALSLLCSSWQLTGHHSWPPSRNRLRLSSLWQVSPICSSLPLEASSPWKSYLLASASSSMRSPTRRSPQFPPRPQRCPWRQRPVAAFSFLE